MLGAARLAQVQSDGGIDVTFLSNGIYSLNGYGLTGSDAIEFALQAGGGPAVADDAGDQLRGGDGGGLVHLRAQLYFGSRDYRLIINDDGCRIEGSGGAGGLIWSALAICQGRGGSTDPSITTHWNLISATVRNGGFGGTNDGNNWQRRGGGAAGFLSNGQNAETPATFTDNGRGGGGNSPLGNTNGAPAGASANRNGLDYGGGAGAEFGGLGTRGRPFARMLAKSPKTFPSGA